MAKVVLQKVGENYYSIPDPGTPTHILKKFKSSSTSSAENEIQTLNYNVDISMLDKYLCESNKDLADDLLASITSDKIKEIEDLTGIYRVVIEYSLTNENGCEIEHSSIVEFLEPTHCIIPLGVNASNECVYRHALLYDFKAVINGCKKIPIGVMRSKAKSYTLNILSISIYHAKDETDICTNQNNSVYGNRYSHKSLTISQIIRDSVCVFDSSDECLTFSPLSMSYVPRRINLNFRIALANIINIYDESYLEDILNGSVGGDPEEGEDNKDDDNDCDCMDPENLATRSDIDNMFA